MSTRIRFLVITGALGALSIVLSLTPLGFIPWVGGASLTTMHIPVIVGAIIEGPVAGAIIGGIFGIFGMIRAAIAPQGPLDPLFVNPLVSLLPRLLIGPAAWGVWSFLKRFPLPALILAGIAGSLVNTVLVLSALGLLEALPWKVIAGVAVANGLPEAAAAALITLAVVAAWKRIDTGKGRSSLPDLPEEGDSE
ncbi:ECF transporter S component [Marispirochaeta aestuarii]|uniref:ECF transporter S component n=1 Tax=Marispirochaeta aestuarii TaxID=1963862 RepID=UPI0029C7CABC|nr:ECF transporter S component [Marispirochaeta aestuarii]